MGPDTLISAYCRSCGQSIVESSLSGFPRQVIATGGCRGAVAWLIQGGRRCAATSRKGAWRKSQFGM